MYSIYIKLTHWTGRIHTMIVVLESDSPESAIVRAIKLALHSLAEGWTVTDHYLADATIISVNFPST